ncbi:hypothetical protein N431DRAFT_434261 [Stipitochalara longipes BDJ]|nr:hypothetical protein N431DRAFT_434261 [Stipitochalara longipes BDJ]
MAIEGTGEGTNLCSFTPVRRRESTINARLFQGDQEQEWTAARCHRLLRALTSRVAILKKELGHSSSATQHKKEQDPEISRGGKRTANTRADADWVQARKRIRQTYSKKSIRTESGPQENGKRARGLLLKKGRKSMVPGEIAVPTPVLVRARGWPLAEEARQKVTVAGVKEPVRRTRSKKGILANNWESHFQLSESLPEMRKRITATRYSTYEGIYSGLEALLRATTTNSTPPKSKGARSLLSMSLRAVPCYITQQEALLQAYMEQTGSKSAIENRDISAEIYDELEGFGSSGNGWKRLKTIVRSHGIRVISDAIYAGLLDVEFAGALIALCVNTSAVDEAQSLLSALLTFAPCPSPRTPYDVPSRPLVMLGKFTEHTGRYSFQYRQLSTMVSNHVMPVEWLATKEFGPVWTRIAYSLAPSLDNIEAMNFLDLTLTKLSDGGVFIIPDTCSAINGAVYNTFSSLLTILSSVVILSKGVELSSPLRELGFSHDYKHVSGLLRGCLAGKSHSNIARSDLNPLLLMANLFVNDAERDSSGFCDSLLHCLLRQLGRQYHDSLASSQVYLRVVDFICLVALCCGRGTSTSGFEHLQLLHLLIESVVGDIERGSVFKGLIVDSAFAFAQKVPDRQHIDYATIIDQKFCARRFGDDENDPLRLIGNSKESRTGFRWEEGIGEWVTATPAIAIARRSIAEASLDFENETPFRPPPKAGRIMAFTNEPTVDLPSPCIDEFMDISEVSMEDSEAALDELGSCLESDHSVDHGVFAESDNESAVDCQTHTLLLSDESTGSIFDAEVSIINASCASDGLSPIHIPGSPVEKRYETLGRVPRLSRRLFGNTEDWSLFHNVSSLSASCTLPDESSDQEVQRDCIDRAPRLGRRALRSSQGWQMFDESDDELSFLSTSSQRDQVLQDITNTTVSRTRHFRQANPPFKQKRSVPSLVSHTDSEDELCA